MSPCHCQIANEFEAPTFFEIALAKMDKIVLHTYLLYDSDGVITIATHNAIWSSHNTIYIASYGAVGYH